MFKKLISSFLIVSQLGLSVGAFADGGTVVTTPHAEMDMLQTVLALKGLALSDRDLNNELQTVVKRYDAEAPTDGRDARFQQALIDLRLYTAQQAKAFTVDAQSAEANLNGQKFDTAAAHQLALESQLKMLAQLHPTGAQFSSCGLGWGLTATGAAAAIIGLVLFFYNPTCHDGPGYSCQQQECQTCYDYNDNPYDCDCQYYQSTCHDTVCDNPDDHPDQKVGTITLIAGGVTAAAGIAMLLVNQDSCY